MKIIYYKHLYIFILMYTNLCIYEKYVFISEIKNTYMKLQLTINVICVEF